MHSCIKNKILILALVLVVSMTIVSVQAFAAASGTHTPITGVTVGVSGASDNSMSNGAVTVTAKGSAGVFGFGASSKTATITITNDSGTTATVSFDWTATSVNRLTIDSAEYTGTSGSFSKVMNPNTSITATIETAKNSTTNKLVMSNFSVVAAKANSNVKFLYDSSLGAVTVDGNTVASNSILEISSSGASLVATEASGAKFLGWIGPNGKILAMEKSFIFQPDNDMDVSAIFVSTANATAWFIVDGTYLTDDLNTAGSLGEIIVLANSGTLKMGEYIIAAGDTLLIPFDDVNTYRGEPSEVIWNSRPNGVLDYDQRTTADSEYRRFTMASGANITVNGTLEVGGLTHPMGAGQKGAYGLIQMSTQSSISVGDGAKLYTWGYIRGSGTVSVASGGLVFENFDATDYPGSADRVISLTGDYKVFPFKQFSLNNVEVEMTIHAGGEIKGFACIYGESIRYNTVIRTAIGTTANGTDDPPLIELSNGTVTKAYVSGRQKFAIDGDVALNNLRIAIEIPLLGGFAADTADTSGLPLPSNWDLRIAGGTSTINDNVLVLAGASFTIDENAHLIIPSGKSVYVFANNEDPSTAADAKVDINGTVTVDGHIYTTKSGAQVTSSNGTGVIILNAIGSETSVAVKKNATSAENCEITPAKLLNGNGQYIDSIKGTYTYCARCDGWHICDHMTNVELGNNLNMHFGFSSASITDWTGYTAWIGDKVYTITQVENEEFFKVVYEGLAAKQMTDTITVTIKNGDKVIDIWSDSIQNYAMRLYNKDTTSENLKAVIVDMLNYGAACQVQFDYNTKNLANAQLGNAAKDYDKKETGALENDLNASEISIDARNLEVKSNILFHIAFNGNVAERTVHVSFTGHKGNSESFDLTVAENGTIVIDKLVVADYNSVITLTFADGTELTTKLIDYIEDLGGSETNNVFYAFKEFAKSAYTYLHSKNTQGGQA